MPRRIDPARIAEISGASYPPPLDEKIKTRTRRHLGDAAELTQFGVNILTVPPGTWSSQRHWHTHEDEFFYILSGELVLVTDEGEELMRAGDAAGFRCGEGVGQHFQNRSDQPATLLAIGSRNPDDVCYYPDLDLVAGTRDGKAWFTHRDGTPYPQTSND